MWNWWPAQHIFAVSATFITTVATVLQAHRAMKKAAYAEGVARITFCHWLRAIVEAFRATGEAIRRRKKENDSYPDSRHFRNVAVLWLLIGFAALLSLFAEIIDAYRPPES